MAELPDKPHAADVPESLRDAIEPLMRKLEGLWRYLAEQAEQEDATQEVADLGRHIRQLETRFNGMRGDGNVLVRTGAAGANFSLAARQEEPRMLPAEMGFWGRITATGSATNNRWTYTFEEVAKTSAAYAGWAAVTGGRSGSAYNTIEDINAASGTQGNGVGVANLDTAAYTFTMQPCPVGNIFWMQEVAVGGATEYWFSYENGVDGSCD